MEQVAGLIYAVAARAETEYITTLRPDVIAASIRGHRATALVVGLEPGPTCTECGAPVPEKPAVAETPPNQPSTPAPADAWRAISRRRFQSWAVLRSMAVACLIAKMACI